jgi:hypothetical protein
MSETSQPQRSSIYFSEIGTKGGQAFLAKYGRQAFVEMGKRSAAKRAAKKEANAND